MKKLLIVLRITIGLVGCSDHKRNETPSDDVRRFFNVVCDHETGVEYFIRLNAVTPRFNLDGTLKKCE